MNIHNHNTGGNKGLYILNLYIKDLFSFYEQQNLSNYLVNMYFPGLDSRDKDNAGLENAQAVYY